MNIFRYIFNAFGTRKNKKLQKKRFTPWANLAGIINYRYKYFSIKFKSKKGLKSSADSKPSIEAQIFIS